MAHEPLRSGFCANGHGTPPLVVEKLCRKPCAISAATAADTSSSAAASTRILWRFGGKFMLIRDAGGWFPCGSWAGWWRTVGPVGSRPAGGARCAGRAMSGAGKLDGARHARCKNMDRTGAVLPSAATEPVSPLVIHVIHSALGFGRRSGDGSIEVCSGAGAHAFTGGRSLI